ncbi:nitroreductase family protein [Streptomyces virginiae]|uniref:nitroreductase family protein n=1 Tax=Streptomyces virginiae TaxID=1961 RepID=UPI0022536FE9|nr:nitroreductase [Streptomyces virginiae]MCX4721183.1 nitroreductase [Streptomyces virginiae]MCX5275695.1 nitroreductase [Streptomyces virginiae]
METLDNVLTRRSANRLTGPAPDDAELEVLLKAAMTAPDHGRLLPWRLVTLRGEDRVGLGRCLAGLAADDPGARERAAAKPLRAPLLLAIVFSPVEHPKVQRWEQLAATAAVVHTLSLLLHDRGYASIWRTGPATEDSGVRGLHGLGPGEQLLGWLYAGTSMVAAPPRRPYEVGPRLIALADIAGPN